MKFYLFGTMRTCFLMQLVLLAVFFVSVSVARADIITFQYDGELTEVDAPLEGTFSVGGSFSGTYSFTLDVPPDEFGFNYGHFIYDAVTAMTFRSNGFMASANTGYISIDFEDAGDVPDQRPAYEVEFDSISLALVDVDFFFETDKMILEWGLTGNNVPAGINTFDPDTLLTIHPMFDPVLNDPDYPNLHEDGSLSFYFSGAQGQQSSIKGKLNTVTLVSDIPSISIPDNKWIQIGLNTAPPTGSTVADIFGDDISAPYGSEWVIYSYKTSTNSYKLLSLTDNMLPGIGYWFIQVTGNPITIDMPSASTGVDVTGHPACTSIPEGCFEIPLQTSNSIDNQWQMIGYPFRDSRNIDKLRVVTASPGSDCFIGCTLKEANEKGLVSEPMYHFDGASYQQLTTDGSEPFKPWDGAWIATLPAASGQQPKLLIPATN